MHSPTIKHTTGFFLSLTAAMLWGMLPVALKELLAGMDAITIVWYRFFVAGVVLFAWLAFQGKLPQPLRQGVQIKWFLLFAAVGLCINY
ncbi:MAG: EamA family transporter, partial [Gammaproteobacteria bacterium]|nr:EamA family transporter [Gammaproteobacteria bacterium]